MSLIIPPGFAEVAVELTATGDPDPWYCTFGLDISAAGDDYPAIGLAVMDSWDFIMNYVGNYVTNTGVAFTVGQDGPDNLRVFTPALTSRPGLSSTGKLPQNCALLVRKNSGLGGRRNRGRMFIPAVLAEGDVNNVGQIEPASLGIVTTAVESFFDTLTSLVGLPMSMVILHGTGGVSVAGDPTPVTSLSVDTVIATQRRRLR